MLPIAIYHGYQVMTNIRDNKKMELTFTGVLFIFVSSNFNEKGNHHRLPFIRYSIFSFVLLFSALIVQGYLESLLK